MLYSIVGILVIIVDQLVKIWVEDTLFGTDIVRFIPGVKCPRCWKHSVDADPETGLCPRCAAVIAEH